MAKLKLRLGCNRFLRYGNGNSYMSTRLNPCLRTILKENVSFACCTEYKTPTGRIDMVIGTEKYLYVF